jgi:nucleoside-diphosphate-sugar epimerase
MRVAVTGATGFIGSHLLERLLEDEHHVTTLVRNPVKIPLLKARGIAAIRGAVDDPASLERVMVGSDVVFHLARAKAHGTRPTEVFAVNVDGTRNVVRAAVSAGVPRLVHCSSSAVYGSRPGLAKESERVSPDSAYSRSKCEAEELVVNECGSSVAPVIARITAVLGPRCMSWLGLFRSAGAGKLRVAGDGSNMHHPADVSDIVDGLMRCAFTPAAAGRTYNLAGPEPLTIAELRRIMAEEVRRAEGAPGSGVQPRSYSRSILDVYYHAGRVTDKLLGLRLPYFESVSFITADRVLDLTRAREDLGYVPRVGVREAVQRTVDWYTREGVLGPSGT